MNKVIIDDELWKALQNAAIRFVGRENYRGNADPTSENDPGGLAIYDNQTFLALCQMAEEEQDWYISRLNQLGVILDAEKVYRQIADWNKRDGFGRARPAEKAKMSDDVLDKWTQYLHINMELMDDPEIYAEDYIN